MATGGFTGIPLGGVQSTFPSQMGSAQPGEWLASDNDLMDKVTVMEPGGIAVGLGVTVRPNPVPLREGMDNAWVYLPTPGDGAANLYGVIGRQSAAWADPATGKPMIAAGKTAILLRPIRLGCRVWVDLTEPITNVGDSVYWVTTDTGVGRVVGSFSNAPMGHAVAGGPGLSPPDSVLIQGARWIGGGIRGGVGIIEFSASVAMGTIATTTTSSAPVTTTVASTTTTVAPTTTTAQATTTH